MDSRDRTNDNLIIASLSEDERLRIVRRMERVELPTRRSLYGRGEKLENVYFPLEGIASVTATVDDGTSVETLMVGSEGCVGFTALFDIGTPSWNALQQVPGAALRISVGDLYRETSAQNTHLRENILRFAGFAFTQVMQTAACNRVHEAAPRCARWLLGSRDRVGSDTFPITHEFIGDMLGASRSSVSTILRGFEEEGVLEHSRGRLQILSVERLEHRACECRRSLSQEYARYLADLKAITARFTDAQRS